MNVLKKLFWIILPAIVLAIFLLPQGKSTNKVDLSAVDFELKVNKFDSTFFNTPVDDLESRLPQLREDFPLFFEGSTNEFWINARSNDVQNRLYNEVKKIIDYDKAYADLNNLLKHYYYYYPNRPKYEVTTYVSNLDFYNPIIVADTVNKIFLATDDYLGGRHPAYAEIDEYLAFYRDQKFLSSELAETLMINAARVDNDDLTLLNQMIWWGKIMYAKKRLLPDAPESMIMRYPTAEWQFCVDNEQDIWVFFVRENLLFDTKEETKRRFIYLAPFSKFFTDFDSKTPGMIGQWIGLKIVESYMENNEVTLQELMLDTDHKAIFNNSKYRP